MKCCGWVRQFSGISFYPLLVLERFIFRSLTLCLDRRGEELGLDTGCFGIRCYLAACSCCSPGKCCCCCSDNCCLTELCSWSVVVCSLGCCCSCSGSCFVVACNPGCCCSCLMVCSCCLEVCSPGCYSCCWEACSLGCSCFLVVGIPGTGLEGTSSSHQKVQAKTCDKFLSRRKG